ncbi:hypothetical protein [Yersinia aleksiciae]|nr:hypothetical protein [Yersinia aleksiciae]MDA5496764.1 hypothetical protein [Yersinia aleksiciae]
MMMVIGWYLLYRNRDSINLTEAEQKYLDADNVNVSRKPMDFKEWRGDA